MTIPGGPPVGVVTFTLEVSMGYVYRNYISSGNNGIILEKLILVLYSVNIVLYLGIVTPVIGQATIVIARRYQH